MLRSEFFLRKEICKSFLSEADLEALLIFIQDFIGIFAGRYKEVKEKGDLDLLTRIRIRRLNAINKIIEYILVEQKEEKESQWGMGISK